jgi:hypothetical protein
MFNHHWFQWIRRRFAKPTRDGRGRNVERRFRPCLEQLEDRSLPSCVVCSTDGALLVLGDIAHTAVPDPSPPRLTLRPASGDDSAPPGFPYPADRLGDVVNRIGEPGAHDSAWIDLGAGIDTLSKDDVFIGDALVDLGPGTVALAVDAMSAGNPMEFR